VRFGAEGCKARLEVIAAESDSATVGTVLMSCGAYGRTRRPERISCEGLEQTGLLGRDLFGADSRGRSVHAAAQICPLGLAGIPLSTKCSCVCRGGGGADADRRISRLKSKCGCPSMARNGAGWNGKLRGRGNGGFSERCYQQLGSACPKVMDGRYGWGPLRKKRLTRVGVRTP